MSKDKLIPVLRFLEFMNEGEWDKDDLGKIANNVTTGKLDANAMVENGKYRFYTCAKNYYRIDDYAFDKEAILIAGNGAYLGYIHHYKGKFNAYQRTYVLSDFSKDVLYLKYYLERFLPSRIASEKKEGNTPYIVLGTITDMVVLFPKNPQEQQKIASCLSSLDEVIAAHSQKLELLKDHKKGLMQNLFPQEGETVPKYRFKEFEKDGEWVEKTLIDTADKKVKWSFTGGPFGSNLMASDYKESGFRIIQLQNIGDGVFNDDNKIFASLEKADELLSCNIYAGDIIISKMGDPVGRACIIPDNLHRCIMASDGIRLVVDETKYSKYFIYSLINSKRIREAIEKRATGSTRKRIGLDTLREIELIVPKSPKEQQKIASCLSSLDALITAQAEKIEQLKLHKKGLMQGLFPEINDR